MICGTFTKLTLDHPQPLPSCEFLKDELSWQRKLHIRLRAKLRSEYCLDTSCILRTLDSKCRVFGIVYSSIGRELIDLHVEIDFEDHKPRSVQINRVIPLPFRMQGSGLLKLQSFYNACEEIILVFADRSGAGMYAPYRSNFNEGCIWVTRYEGEKGLEVLNLTSRFWGRKPKDIVYYQNKLYFQVNDNDWISWSLCKEIDPIAEKHMRFIFNEVFGVSSQDCHGWLSPHSSGELDKEFFSKLTTLHRPLFSTPLSTPDNPKSDYDPNNILLGGEFDDFSNILPDWMQDDLATLHEISI